MRKAAGRLLVSLLMGILLSCCGTDPAGTDQPQGAPSSPYPNDDRLRINQIQCLGTHNSYHKTGEAGGLPFFQYNQEPLDVQLEMGVRQLELDIHDDPEIGLKVFHMPLFDPFTNCDTFVECLGLVKGWSDEHPGHQVIFLFIEPKDEMDTQKLAGHMGQVDAEILSVWPRQRVFAPDDLLAGGDYDNVLDAVLTGGWPLLGAVRNRVMYFLIDSGPLRDEYVGGDPALSGRMMFVRGGSDDPFGGFRNIDGPLEDQEKIREAVTAGYLIRTRSDASCIEAYLNDTSRQEAALTSGAQMISTDFPAPPPYSEYHFEIPGGTPSRCNPVTAPDFCTPGDVESLDADDFAHASVQP
jgi:hypothetical protein